MAGCFKCLIVSTLFFSAFLGCNSKNDEQPRKHIDYLKAYDIPVLEPSGLDLTTTQDGFWSVSDENSTVYKLDKWGKVVKSFKVNGYDLEGIAVLDEKRLAVVLERSREIVIIDTSGNELSRKAFALEGEENKGLEGITYDSVQKRIYVLNEKDPCLLITLDDNLNELSRDTLKFLKDASGIKYESKSNHLWILSDENRLIAKCDFKGNPELKYYISIVQPEGITIDSTGQRMYVVSDPYNALYVYELK